MNKHFRKAVVFSGLLVAGAASAGTETTTLNVTASVPGSCSISTDPAAFGEIGGPSSPEVTANGNVTVNCSVGTSFIIGMDQGQNHDGTFRAMKNPGGDLIRYIILKPGASDHWGDNGIVGGNFPQSPVSGIGSGSDETIPFIAKANGSGMGTGLNTYTPNTSYSDTVTVTVQF